MTTKQVSQEAALDRRIRRFYTLVSKAQFAKCYAMIDPVVLADPASVTLLQYQHSLDSFLNHFGKMEVQEIRMQLHLGQPNRLYGDRDFAVGQTIWLDQAGQTHTFQERWVRVGRNWYTRSTGFVTPAVEDRPA
jgi:hypothetical protein